MILVFGSINVDVMVPVPRLPLAGETVLGGDYALMPGGKGANQALAARRAGSRVIMAGAVGDDGFAAVALETLRRDGVDLSLVRRVDCPTGCAAIMVGMAGENSIAVAPGANRLAEGGQTLDDVLGPPTILICQMEVPAGETEALIRRARARGARIVLNLAPATAIDPALFADIDLLVVNQGEAASLGEEPGRLGRILRRGLVVTHGAAGAVAYLPDGACLNIPALAIEPVDTTGAGDCFVGVLAAGLDAGLGLRDALWRASAAGGLACLGRGAQSSMPDRAAIDIAAARLPGIISAGPRETR